MVERGSERVELLGADGSERNTLIDLSATGAAFNYSTELKKDDCLTVTIQDLSIDARVVYCYRKEEGFRIGMQFRDVTPEARESLKKHIDDFSRGVPLSCEIVERNNREDAEKKSEAEAQDNAQEEAQEEVKEEESDDVRKEAQREV